jgi:predicted HD superfamily hydrolase involved in NAD metabolism
MSDAMPGSRYSDIYPAAREELLLRLTEYRFLHSLSVEETAVSMAMAYGVDPDEARIAGLLHDWDKNYRDDELIERARSFNIPLGDYGEDMAALLHAQTGAEALKRRFPELSPAVIQAVARHTSAAPDMTGLDMVIYIADMIEPLRTQGNLKTLRSLVGKMTLEELFLRAYETTMRHLVSRHRFIHPDSLEVWNAYVRRERIASEQPRKEPK